MDDYYTRNIPEKNLKKGNLCVRLNTLYVAGNFSSGFDHDDH